MSFPRPFQSLPSDVWANALTSITDLKTLNRAVQVSKGVHRVFKRYTKTIMTAVACTEVGPALPSALLHALVEQKVCSEGIESGICIWENEAVGSLLRAVTESTVSFPSGADWDLAKRVAVNAMHIRVSEELYSRKLCDVTSRHSALSPEISERLQRALYRFFLYRLTTFGKFHWDETMSGWGYDPHTVSVAIWDRLREHNERERKRHEKPRRPLKLQFFSRTLKTDGEREDFAAAVNPLETCFSPWFNNAASPVGGTWGRASSTSEYRMELPLLGAVLEYSR